MANLEDKVNEILGLETRQEKEETKEFQPPVERPKGDVEVKTEKDIDKYREFESADIILFDTPGMEKSIEFPKELISKIPKGDKYALAGSISENNAENISKLGVKFFDLSSSLEEQLGYKDHHKITNFINKINELKN